MEMSLSATTALVSACGNRLKSPTCVVENSLFGSRRGFTTSRERGMLHRESGRLVVSRLVLVVRGGAVGDRLHIVGSFFRVPGYGSRASQQNSERAQDGRRTLVAHSCHGHRQFSAWQAGARLFGCLTGSGQRHLRSDAFRRITNLHTLVIQALHGRVQGLTLSQNRRLPSSSMSSSQPKGSVQKNEEAAAVCWNIGVTSRRCVTLFLWRHTRSNPF